MKKLKKIKSNVSIIIGTRPEAIKLAPLIKTFKSFKNIKLRVILSGQHKEMVYEIMDLFNLKVDVDLDVMKVNQSLSDLSSKLIKKINLELEKFTPDLVIVQGDTSTAFIGALAAFYKKIPIAHVEAGLRTNNLFDPFPEEANRRLISQITKLHFAPTTSAKSFLELNGINNNIYLTGNTVIDALNFISKSAKKPEIKGLDFKKYSLILLSVHRRENWGENLFNIIKGIEIILNTNNDVVFIIPMHPNKIVRGPIIDILSNKERVFLIEPLRYDLLVGIMKECKLILTDSGGIQEEAPGLGKPVLVLRNFTERMEAINAGTAKLIGTDPSEIANMTNLLMSDPDFYKSMSRATNPFGDGKASERIAKICHDFLSNTN